MRHRMRQSATNNIRYTRPKCNQRLAYGLTELIRQYIVHFGVIFFKQASCSFFNFLHVVTRIYNIPNYVPIILFHPDRVHILLPPVPDSLWQLK